MQLIETIEVGAGGAASIEFTGIPQDGVDLKVILSGRAIYTGNYADAAGVRLNGSTTSFNYIRLFGTGAAVSTGAQPNEYLAGGLSTDSNTANTYGSIEVTISNYTSAAYKSVSSDGVSENNATNAWQWMAAGLWSNTSAVTSITLVTSSLTNFSQYSTASLYKITAD